MHSNLWEISSPGFSRATSNKLQARIHNAVSNNPKLSPKGYLYLFHLCAFTIFPLHLTLSSSDHIFLLRVCEVDPITLHLNKSNIKTLWHSVLRPSTDKFFATIPAFVSFNWLVLFHLCWCEDVMRGIWKNAALMVKCSTLKNLCDRFSWFISQHNSTVFRYPNRWFRNK